MGMILLLIPLAVVSAPFVIVGDIFENVISSFSDIITIWSNFFA